MKQPLKSLIFEKRDSLSKEEISEKSSKIKQNLYSLKEFQEAKNIMFYVSFNHEVDTQQIIKELLEKHAKIKDFRCPENPKNFRGKEKTVLVPYVIKDDPKLHVSELKNFNELEPKTFGILEPKEAYTREFNPDKIDIVIVPGIAFDKQGHRIGYGYGYYDRFLKTIKKETVKIGLAFDFQVAEDIPEERHDVAVDIVITDKEVFDVR